MKFINKIAYKINCLIPALGLAGATILPNACCKAERDKPDNTPHHNTTYVWGDNNWDAIWPTDKVVASADSTSVDNVFLENDGVSLSGFDVTLIRECMEKVLNDVSVKKRYKIHGSGSLKHLYITNKADSTWLTTFGFKFTEPRYKQK